MGDFSPARKARLERAGAFTAREQADLAHRRHARADLARSQYLPEARVRREMDRANRERVAREDRRRELWIRLERGYASRFRAIAQRVQAEARIRPAGKSIESVRRHRRQMEEALGADAEYLSLCRRRDAASDRLERIRRQRSGESLAAGVLAIDTYQTRKAKVAAFRSAQREAEVHRG